MNLITARETSDGAGVKIFRSIGQRQSLRVNPLLMLDEFCSENPNDYIAGFPAHPHRGFQTLTYMIKGHLKHEDSMGNRGELKSGEVQWMTAGRGIIHSEMPLQKRGLMQGFQLWVNLPAADKMQAANYRDIKASDIKTVTESNATIKIIAGDYKGHLGPITGLTTQLDFFDLALTKGQLEFDSLPNKNYFLYVYEGEVVVNSSLITKRQGICFEENIQITAKTPSQFLILGGKPIDEPIVQFGPFVMNTQQEIEQAIADYQSGALGQIFDDS